MLTAIVEQVVHILICVIACTLLHDPLHRLFDKLLKFFKKNK